MNNAWSWCFALFFLFHIVCGWEYETRTFNQRVDHFNLGNDDSFSQKYLVNSGYWGEGGPILFYCGNEGDIEDFWQSTGNSKEMAESLEAIVVFAEHRFYGSSVPCKLRNDEDSPNRECAGLLNVEQALADYVHLLATLKREWKTDAPVIAFGGSYGGMLAAWMRMKYPDTVDMALAASAPILWPAREEGSAQFFDIVTRVFGHVENNCVSRIRNEYKQLEEVIEKQEFDQLTEIFNLCGVPKDPKDNFNQWLKDAFSTIAMVNTCLMDKFPSSSDSISHICESHYGDFPLFQTLVDTVYESKECRRIPEVVCADKTGCGSGPNAMSWDYQASSEIIYFPQTNGLTDMFPPQSWNLEKMTKYAEEKWHLKPYENRIKELYGGTSALSKTSRIIFSNGMNDPWHGGSVTELPEDARDNDLFVINIKSGAHHSDLRSPKDCDPTDLKDARGRELDILREWLAALSNEE